LQKFIDGGQEPELFLVNVHEPPSPINRLAIEDVNAMNNTW
jgi:hypothetical protein